VMAYRFETHHVFVIDGMAVPVQWCNSRPVVPMRSLFDHPTFEPAKLKRFRRKAIQWRARCRPTS